MVKVIVFDYVLGFYVVVLGLFFYIGDELFECYCNGVFVSEYGSWNCLLVSGF